MAKLGGKGPLTLDEAINKGIIDRDSDGRLRISNLKKFENKLNNDRVFTGALDSFEGAVQRAMRPPGAGTAETGIELNEPLHPNVTRQIQSAGNDFVGLTFDRNGIIAVDPDRDRMFVGSTILHTGGGSRGLISDSIFNILRTNGNGITSGGPRTVAEVKAETDRLMANDDSLMESDARDQAREDQGPLVINDPRALQELMDNGLVDLASHNRLKASGVELVFSNGRWLVPGTTGYSDFSQNVQAGAAVGHNVDALTGGSSGLQAGLSTVSPVPAQAGAAASTGPLAPAPVAASSEGKPKDTETYDEAIARRIANRDAARLAGDTAKVATIEAKIRDMINASTETIAETYMRRVRSWQAAKAAGDTDQVRRIEALLNINAPAEMG